MTDTHTRDTEELVEPEDKRLLGPAYDQPADPTPSPTIDKALASMTEEERTRHEQLVAQGTAAVDALTRKTPTTNAAATARPRTSRPTSSAAPAKKPAPVKKTAAAKKAAPAKKATTAKKTTPARKATGAKTASPAKKAAAGPRKTAASAPANPAKIQPGTATAPTASPAQPQNTAKETGQRPAAKKVAKKKVRSAARIARDWQRMAAWSKKHPWLALFGLGVFATVVSWRYLAKPTLLAPFKAGRAIAAKVAAHRQEQKELRRIQAGSAGAAHPKSCKGCGGRGVKELRDAVGQYQGSITCPGA